MAKFFIFPFANIGDKVAIPDDVQPSGSVSYDQGFGPDYARNLASDPLAKPFPRSQFNQLMYDITSGIQQYQTHGTPDFIASSDNEGSAYPYDIYARVRYNGGSGYQIYENQVQGNTALPTDSTWIQISGGAIIPPGVIWDYAGGTVPSGWLLCDGSQVSQTTYSALYAAIGTLWGSNAGGLFTLPDFTRRVSVGSGGVGTGVLGNNVGNVGGEETHTLSIAEMPAHNHAFGTHQSSATAGGGADTFLSGQSINNIYGAAGVPIFNAGGGGSHNNIQPSAIVLKIIKY